MSATLRHLATEALVATCWRTGYRDTGLAGPEAGEHRRVLPRGAQKYHAFEAAVPKHTTAAFWWPSAGRNADQPRKAS